MQMSFAHFLAVLAAVSLPVAGLASVNGSDNAGNYTSWTDGSTGGTGFQPWSLASNDGGTGFAGHFLGNSSDGSGNINTSNQSFGMFANTASGASADATRSFSGGVLSIGQTFSLQLAVNFRNGNKGFDLLAGGSTVFNFNVGGDQYTVNVGGTSTNLLGGAYQPDSVFTLSFTQTNATTMAVSITRTSAAGGTENAYNQNLAIASADGFHLYINGTDGGGSAANNLYANNFAVIPEPSTVVILGAGCLMGAATLRRRRKA